MLDITVTLTTARRALDNGRRADLPILRAMLARDAADPFVREDQRAEAIALVVVIGAAIIGGGRGS